MPKYTVNIVEAKDFEPITLGIRDFVLTSVEEKKSTKGEFINLFWDLTCVGSDEPSDIDKIIKGHCTTLKPDASFGISELRRACGFGELGEGLEIDTDEMLGMQVRAQVKHEPYIKKMPDGTDQERVATRIDRFIY